MTTPANLRGHPLSDHVRVIVNVSREFRRPSPMTGTPESDVPCPPRMTRNKRLPASDVPKLAATGPSAVRALRGQAAVAVLRPACTQFGYTAAERTWPGC